MTPGTARSCTSAWPKSATPTRTQDTGPEPEVELEDRYRERPERPPAAVQPAPPRRDRRHLRRRRPAGAHRTCDRSQGGRGRNGDVRVHLVIPKSFNDAQQVADRFKDDVPVILNLQGVETDLSKRLIDFASGLTYALDGGMQRIADKVFMLTPRNVEISAEERARLIEKGFFNQS